MGNPSSGRGTNTVEQPMLALSHTVAMVMIALSRTDILPPGAPGYRVASLAPTLGLVMPAGRRPAALQREGMRQELHGCSRGRTLGAGNPPRCRVVLLTSPPAANVDKR